MLYSPTSGHFLLLNGGYSVSAVLLTTPSSSMPHIPLRVGCSKGGVNDFYKGYPAGNHSILKIKSLFHFFLEVSV